MSDQAKPLTDEELESIDRKIVVWFERMERDDPGMVVGGVIVAKLVRR